MERTTQDGAACLKIMKIPRQPGAAQQQAYAALRLQRRVSMDAHIPPGCSGWSPQAESHNDKHLQFFPSAAKIRHLWDLSACGRWQEGNNNRLLFVMEIIGHTGSSENNCCTNDSKLVNCLKWIKTFRGKHNKTMSSVFTRMVREITFFILMFMWAQ